jgi:hypothetical protein
MDVEAVNAMVERLNIQQQELLLLRGELESQRAREAVRNEQRERDDFKKSLNRVPKYSGESGTFRRHLRLFENWIRVESVTNPEWQKMALVTSLVGKAADRVRFCGIDSREFVNRPTLALYLEFVTKIFEPDSEKRIATIEFQCYRQRADEDIGAYLGTKLDLFNVAYPGPNQPPFEILMGEAVKGIFSKVIRRMVVRQHPATEEELRTACLNAVSSERVSYEGGFSESTSLDGLCSVTKTQNRGLMSEETAMEIDAMGEKHCFNCNGLGHFARDCRKPKREDKGGKERPRGSAKPTEKGKEGRTCWGCKETGHLHRDCPKEKNRRGVQQIGNESEEEKEEDDEIFFDGGINMMGSASRQPFLGARRRGRRRL